MDTKLEPNAHAPVTGERTWPSGTHSTPLPTSVSVASSGVVDKPQLDLSVSQAESLLQINNLQSGQKSKTKVPMKLLIISLTLIGLVIATSFLIGSFKPGASSQSSSPLHGIGLPNQSDPSSGGDVSNQVNQDVKSCSNTVNALTVC